MKPKTTIIIGDSRRMDELNNEGVHLVITSPPYWQLKDYGNGAQIGFNDSYEDYTNNLNLAWKECYSVLHKGCRLCINIGDQFARSVYYGRYKVIPIRTEIINLANQNAQGTRPKVVGQLSDLIQEFTGKTLNEWEQWYLQRYPDAIKSAKEKISEMVENLKDAIHKIDGNMVDEWVRDLVIVKTFLGLKFQEAILKKGAEIKGVDYRLSDDIDESKGIDGYIGDIPISIKPDTYKAKKSLSENIDVIIIYYEKVKDGIKVVSLSLIQIL